MKKKHFLILHHIYHTFCDSSLRPDQNIFIMSRKKYDTQVFLTPNEVQRHNGSITRDFFYWLQIGPPGPVPIKPPAMRQVVLVTNLITRWCHYEFDHQFIMGPLCLWQCLFRMSRSQRMRPRVVCRKHSQLRQEQQQWDLHEQCRFEQIYGVCFKHLSRQLFLWFLFHIWNTLLRLKRDHKKVFAIQCVGNCVCVCVCGGGDS